MKKKLKMNQPNFLILSMENPPKKNLQVKKKKRSLELELCPSEMITLKKEPTWITLNYVKSNKDSLTSSLITKLFPMTNPTWKLTLSPYFQLKEFLPSSINKLSVFSKIPMLIVWSKLLMLLKSDLIWDPKD